ncbi:MAG: mechanosensitive ion channel [Gammaproteobacteria bacterium]|nr:mechanosensitive ion channel [Gammaproteobacteria bacterium]
MNQLSDYQKYIDIAVEHGSSFGLKLLIALLIFWVGKRVARAISNLVVKAMHKNEVDAELSGFVESLLYWGMVALVAVAALGQLGIQTASFIAILGAAGLAVGLALQGSLSNFAAGVLILMLRPFRVGDWVEMAGVAGKVETIHIFTTELITGDNKCIIVPNARVLDSNIINHSSTGERRVDLVFGISYEDDIDQARSVIEQVLGQEQRILSDKDIRISVSELADSSVNFVVRPWVKTDDYWPVFFDLTEAMKKQFDANDISIPYPQRVVHQGGSAG